MENRQKGDVGIAKKWKIASVAMALFAISASAVAETFYQEVKVVSTRADQSAELLADAIGQRDQAKVKVDQLTRDLVTATRERDQANAKIKGLATEVAVLTKEDDKFKAKDNDLMTRLASVTQERDHLKAKLSELAEARSKKRRVHH